MSEPINSAAFKLVTETNYKRVLAEFYTVAYNISVDKAANPSLAGLKILDLGCGNGELCAEFYARGADQIIGIDISANMIANCVSTEKSSFYKADIFDISQLELILAANIGSFDGICSVWSSQFATDKESLQNLFAFVKRALKPNGVFVMVSSNPAIIDHGSEITANADLKNYEIELISNEIESALMKITFRDINTGEIWLEFVNRCFKTDIVLGLLNASGLVNVRCGALDIDPNSPNLGYEMGRFLNYTADNGSVMCFIAKNQ